MSRGITAILVLIIIIGVQGCASASNYKASSSIARKSKREVEIGMTKQDVLEILGEPTKIRTSQESK